MLLIACIVLSMLASSNGYDYGDPVSMLKRTEQGEWRTKWSPAGSFMSPRFGQNSTIHLTPEFQRHSYSKDIVFKVSFSFSDNRFIVPWITIADGKGHYARAIVLEFFASGNDVTGIRLRTVDRIAGEPPRKITVTYAWKLQATVDAEKGLSAVLLFGFSVTMATLIAMLIQVRRKHCGKSDD